jgi:hypothetical protein
MQQQCKQHMAAARKDGENLSVRATHAERAHSDTLPQQENKKRWMSVQQEFVNMMHLTVQKLR